ncbi:MAG TPA: DUF6371 domain-containing protein [Chitinophaga sp.]|uniref:DUF6371 domain-containing protein n=1 Tax=Chitinophaga sp. TaxID=1869181 RepID=UPI002C197606|nr:DUF6371 domain-containing protein [Chitinophaga sp.]HVI43493.1 DUF6371 domain-containing protein [Chitinophaga sp.]
MREYRFVLEPGSKKHYCPSCGKKTFVRFIDTHTGEYLPAAYGRCDREVKCSYFKYVDGTLAQDREGETTASKDLYGTQPKRSPIITPAYIPFSVLKQSRKAYEGNKFVQYLIRLFGVEITQNLIKHYHLGSSNSRWPGATIFWFIDITGKVRAAQVKLFDNTGHTAKYYTAEGDKRSCTTWLHNILKYTCDRQGTEPPDWLSSYLKQGGNYACCLFGEHLLRQEPTKPVAIVEAPATAIVASVYLPDFLWLATGSLSYLTAERCKALEGRHVCLFPDLSNDGKACKSWSRKAKEIAGIASITVSDILEEHATNEERVSGLDLRDYLTRYPFKAYHNNCDDASNQATGPQLVINNNTFEIKGIVSISCLGERYNHYQFACIALSDNSHCDVLFNDSGEPVNIDDSLSRDIAQFYNYSLTIGLLNGSQCLTYFRNKM